MEKEPSVKIGLVHKMGRESAGCEAPSASLCSLEIAKAISSSQIKAFGTSRLPELPGRSYEQGLKIRILRGGEVIPYIHKIAALRIAIFREYPYLYVGDMSYEERYLRMYSRTEDTILIIAEDNNEVVGAITGVPLKESNEKTQTLFKEKDIPAERIFYLGEIILLPEYRGKKIGYMMYQQFENTLKEMNYYEKITHCEVIRDENDARRPLGYQSLNNFWSRQGYVKRPDLIADFSWKEIGAIEETNHPMVFRIKDLL